MIFLIAVKCVCVLILSAAIHAHGDHDVFTFQDQESRITSPFSSSSSSSSSLVRLPLRQTAGVATTAQTMRRLAAEKRSGIRSNQSEVLPLFQGMGVHYVYIWVGTPPQRVTVIVDTGSHHTAFPCVGCKCGKHVSFLFPY